MNEKLYFLLSPKHSFLHKPVFWRAPDSGYTDPDFPWQAAIFTQNQIDENPTFRNGIDAVPIPATIEGMESIGFKCFYVPEKVEQVVK